MKTIKCLSVRQPWAWLIVAGHKSLENRTWDTKYRGPLLIHASARPDDDPDWLCSTINYAKGIKFPAMPLGSIVGQVNLTAVVTDSDDYFFDGPYAFQLTDPVMFERPIPLKGKLGLYDVPWPMPATKDATKIKFYTPTMIPRKSLLRQITDLLSGK